jgi:phage terminase large subunit
MDGLALIPYRARPHQKAAWRALRRFNVLVWHRRAGKTVFAVNWLIRTLLECQHPEPRGAYISPTYKQTKRIAWSYLKRFTAPIPGMRYLEQELRAVFPTGAEAWLLGGKDCDSLRGIYLDAVVPDETAQLPPRLWGEILRPALSDRLGKALLIGTPFGQANQFHEFYEAAAGLPDWGRSLLTCYQTAAIDPTEIEALKREMRPEEFEQEMLCSFSAAVRGAFFGVEMRRAQDENRITRVPVDRLLPVHTSWDLGMANRTVVWLWQVVGAEIRAVDCRAYSGTGLPEIVADLRNLGHVWGEHFAPHDAAVRELGSGKSRMEMAAALGLRWTIVAQVGVQSGIDATRALLGRCWFDADKCRDGVQALSLYRTEYDEERRVFSLNPLHDWTSDYADAARMFAVGWANQGSGWGKVDYSKLDKLVAC